MGEREEKTRGFTTSHCVKHCTFHVLTSYKNLSMHGTHHRSTDDDGDHDDDADGLSANERQNHTMKCTRTAYFDGIFTLRSISFLFFFLFLFVFIFRWFVNTAMKMRRANTTGMAWQVCSPVVWIGASREFVYARDIR